MMVVVIQWPPLAKLFHTTPLRPLDWLIALGLSLTLVPVVEAVKWRIRRSRPAMAA